MIRVRLKGGLGNQMFQYVLGRILALKNNTDLWLDTSYLNLNINSITKRSYSLDIFNIEAKILNNKKSYFLFKIFENIFLNIFQRKGKEKKNFFNVDILNFKGSIYLNGYWQNPRYFTGHEDVLYKDFVLRNNLSDNIVSLGNKIGNEESVCIHVRRGDFLNHKYHDVLEKDFYKKGIEKLKENTSKIETIYVFSDDISWCKDNMIFDFETIFVDDEYRGGKDEGHLFLMSKCKYFIIPNSTFSWWGAWLSKRDDKIVIAPKKWVSTQKEERSNILPDDWIAI